MRLIFALVCVGMVTGCTFLLDGKGLYDDVDPDAPSAPVIAIAPAEPDSGSTLTVELIQPSTSPLGESVSYEYAWSRDGAAVSDAETIFPNETVRGEEWSVTVTPVGASSGLRGRAGVASVVIANAAPVVRNAGVDNYRPVVGGRIRAVVDELYDADGDAVVPRFQWFSNGAPLSGQTGDELKLEDVGAIANDEISVEISGDDGTAVGPSFAVTRLVVGAKVPRWESLSPAFAVHGAAAFHPDPNGIRWLFVSGEDLWEMVEQASGEVRVTWIGPNEGPTSLGVASSIIDRVNNRAIIYTPGSPDGDIRGEVWSLSFEPSARPWKKLNPSGSAPSARERGQLVYDPERERAILYGGLGPDEAILGDFHALNLTPGDEIWTPIPAVDPEPRAGATLVVDSNRGRLLVIGGSLFARGLPEDEEPGPGRIASLQIDGQIDGDAFTIEPSTLPQEAMHMGATLIPPGDTMIVAYGVFETSDRPTQNAIFRVDLDELDVTALDIPAEQNVPSDRPLLAFDGARGVVTIWDGYTWNANGHALRRFALDLQDETISLDFGFGREFPSRAFSATAAFVGDELVWIPLGSIANGTSLGDVWRFDMVTGRLRPDRILPDPVHDVAPSSLSSNLEIPMRRAGELVGFIAAGGSAWTLAANGDDLRWIFHAAAANPAPLLYPSTASLWEDTCVDYSNRGGFGTFASNGTQQSLSCNVSGYSCSWSSTPAITQHISNRYGMASSVAGTTTYLFGGQVGLSGSSEVFRRVRSGSSCVASFQPVTTVGTGPEMVMAQAIWDGLNQRFVIGGGSGMSGSLWFLEFGPSGNPTTGTPTWRRMGADDVVGPWRSPMSTGRIAAYKGRVAYATGAGALYLFHPEG